MFRNNKFVMVFENRQPPREGTHYKNSCSNSFLRKISRVNMENDFMDIACYLTITTINKHIQN